MRGTLQPLPTYVVHKGWGATNRVRKIRLTGPLAKPKKETSPTKYTSPFAKPQRRGSPIEAFSPFYINLQAFLVPTQNEGPIRSARKPIMESLPKIREIEYIILQIQPNLINKERRIITVHHQTGSPNKKGRLSQIKCSFYIHYQIQYR